MRKLLIASIVCLIGAVVCFGAAIEINYRKKQREQHQRHQPYVVLNTEEQINSGDTLYVIAATKDSIWLYGK